MTFGMGPKVVKRCPQGHVMQMAWRTCPKCTGHSVGAGEPGRSMSDATIILGAPAKRPEPAAAAPPTWVALLTVAGGPADGKAYEIPPGRWKFGRAPREEAGITVVAVPDTGMSREHFALEAGVAAVVLRDLGSTNGTFVNGSRVERHMLKEGDTVQAGATAFRVRLALRSA
jgi:FHA domain